MSKYGNKKIVIDGYKFDSLAEGRRYGKLKILELRGDISKLEIHPRFDLHVNSKKICAYVADFQYIESGIKIVEDVKGVKTAVYRIKNKMMMAEYGIKILETDA